MILDFNHDRIRYMILTASLLALGLVLLIAGGAWLVRGATDIASAFGVSPLIVGLTVVGFGTSAPELVVNIVGALEGATDLAFGNVVGSNIANLALVLGIAAVLAPITIQGDVVRRELPLLLLATTVILVMTLDGPLQGLHAIIDRSESVILLLLFCVFIYINAIDLLRTRQTDAIASEIEESTIAGNSHRHYLSAGRILLGLVMLYFGGEMTVASAVELAGTFGVSEAIVGLFVVAVGTSMPELVTTSIAALRRQSDLALGNVVGSNIFNSLIVLPASGLVLSIDVPSGGVADLIVSWLLAAILIPVFYIGRARLGRVIGGGLLASYVLYAVFRVSYGG